MRCGLFGKLGARRDFIAVATPRGFLEAWEPWVQACLSASRHRLGPRWQQAYLTAPVWRFWLGEAICGANVAGAIMPSLDGVGRYYPLTVHAVADVDTSIAPPDVDAQDDWFGAAEAFLLSTLSREASFEAIAAVLDELAPPVARPRIAGDGVVPLGRDLAATDARTGDFAETLSVLRSACAGVYAAASFWWTAGGDDFAPLALCCRGLPDPYRYSTLLTGELDGEGEQAQASDR
jgi:type VI secretion system protein ImpM